MPGKLSRLLSCAALVASLHFHAQDFFDEDARFWLYVKLDKNITKRLNAQLIVQDRFNYNITEFSQFNLNPEFNYTAARWLRLVGGFVWGNTRQPEQYYRTRYQVYGGVMLRKNLHRMKLRYRNIVQGQETLLDFYKKRPLHYYDRNKFTFGYQLSKYLEPYVAAEFNLPLLRARPAFVNRTRLFAGLVVNLTRHSYIEGYFLYQAKYYGYGGYPPRDYIYGFTYSHSF